MSKMIYKLSHRSTYKYRYPVSGGNHVACLKPRTSASQRLIENELIISPEPAIRSERVDYFGNRLCFFTVQEPHKELIVESRCVVELVRGVAAPPSADVSWEAVRDTLAEDFSEAGLEAYQFVFESPRIRMRPEFAAYARESFTPERPMREALLHLTTRIFTDFKFDAKSTNVRTTPEDVFKKRRGVCQDFAQLQIACLRSIGLAARYVSGYLRTYQPVGKPRLIGADASHAWLAAYVPGAGWVDVDPTNNLVPSDGHVTLAWGRDYGDVSPLRGLVLGGGDHTLKVAVDLEPVE